MIGTVQLPPACHPGDLVGVAALSGRVDEARLDRGLEALRALGFRIREASNLRLQSGLFAGEDRQRLDGFHQLAADPEVRAIFFARGGWGVPRLLPDIDWDLLARYPRAYVGYSDLTPFLQQVIERLGLAAFHGPLVAADFERGLTDEEVDSLLGALRGDYPARIPLLGTIEWDGHGAAEGPLLGGCLSLLTALLGTPWAGDLESAMLFIEDLEEPPYRFDRMLTHLHLSDTLRRIRGMIVGHLHGEGGRELTAFEGRVTLRGVLREGAASYPWPLAFGLPAGHARPNYTLPLGPIARLDAEARELIVGLG